MDALSPLLSRFAASAGVFHTGRICGMHGFTQDEAGGELSWVGSGPVTRVDAQAGS